jgi:hypothetical protein
MRTVKPGEIYCHYKGNLYEIVGVAHHSEHPEEEFVVYRHLGEEGSDRLWIRPKVMFLEKIQQDGKNIYRFKKLADKNTHLFK